VTTTALAGHLARLTPRLQVAVVREGLSRMGLEEQWALVDGLAADLEWEGYGAAAALLRRAYGQAVPTI
jgi:hypothetical protein